MSYLKPCPCGAKAKLLKADGLSESYSVFNDVMYSKVICQQCSFSADDVEDWNNRAPQSQWVSVDEFSKIQNELNSCKEFIAKAFEAHPNIDIDIEDL